MKAQEIKQKYLEFFKERGHAIIPSSSLIPENDPSVLFTTAGMHPLVPFLLGEKHPAGNRLTSAQKCVRTGDIDEVGDDVHLTFFEMLGNWSLGDPAEPDQVSRGASYWKKEAIIWSYEFLTDAKWLGLDKNKLAISVFGGDEDCLFDEESYNLWLSLGITEKRITRLGKDDNWWPAGGKNPGPQGPDTEIFYWTGATPPPAIFDPKDPNWVEIWNDVFMQYNRTLDGKYEPLKQTNVDTGMGVERTAAVLQGKKSVYEIELFAPIISYLKSVAKNYDERSAHIIADHLRSAIMIMADDLGILPSNLKQGYVVRKLIRRAIRYAKKIGIPESINVSDAVCELVIDSIKDAYPELSKNREHILKELDKEEEGFEKTLEKGLKEFNNLFNNFVLRKTPDKRGGVGVAWSQGFLHGDDAFYLYSTFGFPKEIMQDLCKEHNIGFEEQGFDEKFQKHQELSRTASAGMFKGGLADHSEIVVKYHTATHLLHQALKDVLGSHANQKGSNITAERLRFDFTHPDKMTAEQIKRVEEIVNQKIKDDLSVHFEEMSVDQARERGAVGLFGEKYGDKVKVYFIGNYSKEICGGPHVERTGTMGTFKITKEEAVSAGVRRIKAILS